MNNSLYERPVGSLRPREKLQHSGIQNLSDHELVQLVLGSGCRQVRLDALAKRCLDVMDRRGGSLSLEDLESVEGIGPAKASVLVGSIELARRLALPAARRISSPLDLYHRLAHFADRPQEIFLTSNLNGAQELLAIHTVTIGLLNRTLIHPREVFAPALQERAASLILAHTHPSGRLEPSREDCEVTTRLYNAGKLLGIEILDHIIFSQQGFYSFKEHNLVFL